jgi:hypothetical protein
MTVPNWLFQTILIALAASAVLNGSSFLPLLRDLRPSRIEARWVGYTGLTIAFWLWIVLNPDQPAAHVGTAWIILCLITLIPNTIIHLYHRENGHNPEDNGSPSPLTRRQQALLENAIAEHLEIKQATAVLETMLKALHDPRYARDPDHDSILWRNEAKKKMKVGNNHDS